jgi:hypothetical protein
MNNITEIINYIGNRKDINTFVELLRSCNESIITRNKKMLNTVACRLWQLQYCIFCYIYNNNKNLLQNSDFLIMLCKVYNKIFTDSNSPLYKFILLNKLTDPIIYIPYIGSALRNNDFKNYIINNINTYCCIYGINKKSGTIQESGIVHYFTIINDKIGNYYITSSYGSDNVCIPYQLEKLHNLQDFIDFCECLYRVPYVSQEESLYYNECILNFMNNYFLKGGIKKRWSQDYVDEIPELRHQWILPDKGSIKESKYITHNTVMNFDIAIITNYQELVEKEILQDINTTQYIKNHAILTDKIREVTKTFSKKTSIKSPISKKKI